MNIKLYDTKELIEITKASKYQVWDLTRKNGYIKPFKKIKNKNYYSIHQLFLVKLWIEFNKEFDVLKNYMKTSNQKKVNNG